MDQGAAPRCLWLELLSTSEKKIDGEDSLPVSLRQSVFSPFTVPVIVGLASRQHVLFLKRSFDSVRDWRKFQRFSGSGWGVEGITKQTCQCFSSCDSIKRWRLLRICKLTNFAPCFQSMCARYLSQNPLPVKPRRNLERNFSLASSAYIIVWDLPDIVSDSQWIDPTTYPNTDSRWSLCCHGVIIIILRLSVPLSNILGNTQLEPQGTYITKVTVL